MRERDRKSKTKQNTKKNRDLFVAHICICAQTCTRSERRKKAGIFAKRKSQRIKIDGKIYIRRNKSLKTIKTTLWWMWSQRRERALAFVHPQFHSINLRDVLLPNIMPRTQIYGIFFRSWFIAHFSFSLPYNFTFWLFSRFFLLFISFGMWFHFEKSLCERVRLK